MTSEAPTQQENQEFDAICERFGVAGRYKVFMKRNSTNQTTFRTVTVRDRNFDAYESYYADSPPDSSRYWLQQFLQALAEDTFGSRSPPREHLPGRLQPLYVSQNQEGPG